MYTVVKVGKDGGFSKVSEYEALNVAECALRFLRGVIKHNGACADYKIIDSDELK